MKKQLIYFHQGWTDTMNCLPLVDYYLKFFPHIFVLMRSDARALFDFYIIGKNITAIYIDKHQIDNNPFHSINLNEYQLLFHGMHDKYRNDKYFGVFTLKEHSEKFVEYFYRFYDIDIAERVNSFNITRDLVQEDALYEQFVNLYSNRYGLYHDNSVKPIKHLLSAGVEWISLSNINDNPFLMNKIIANAYEIHLIDSMWAACLYLLDAKYSLFQNIKIHLYLFRDNDGLRSRTISGGSMIDESNKALLPVNLKNWMIK